MAGESADCVFVDSLFLQLNSKRMVAKIDRVKSLMMYLFELKNAKKRILVF